MDEVDGLDELDGLLLVAFLDPEGLVAAVPLLLLHQVVQVVLLVARLELEGLTGPPRQLDEKQQAHNSSISTNSRMERMDTNSMVWMDCIQSIPGAT